jgi:hypothetical protein
MLPITPSPTHLLCFALHSKHNKNKSKIPYNL